MFSYPLIYIQCHLFAALWSFLNLPTVPPFPLSLNNRIKHFLSRFWSLKSSSVFFYTLTKSYSFCAMFFFFFNNNTFFFVGILCLARPVLWLSSQDHAVFRRASPPSASPPLSPLPLSWKAFTRAHWAPWQTVGVSRGERGCFDKHPPPVHSEPNVSARARRDGWDRFIVFIVYFLLGWQEMCTCCLSKPFNTQLFLLLSIATLS